MSREARALTPLDRLEAVAIAHDPVEGPVEFSNAAWISIRTDIFMVAQAARSENAPFTDPRIIREMRTALELIANGGLNEAKLVAIAAQALYNVRPPER